MKKIVLICFFLVCFLSFFTSVQATCNSNEDEYRINLYGASGEEQLCSIVLDGYEAGKWGTCREGGERTRNEKLCCCPHGTEVTKESSVYSETTTTKTAAPKDLLLPKIDFSQLKSTAFKEGGVINLARDLTLGEIITNVLNIVFVVAGLILFLNIIQAGFQLLIGAQDPKAKDAASKQITNSIIGFIIIFVAYWIVQAVEIVLGISILK